MKLVTKVYPVSENRLSSGAYEYGFVTGEKNKETGFFENSSIITRTFKKRQRFAFLEEVKCVVDSGSAEDEANNGNKRKSTSVMKLSDLDISKVGFPSSDYDE